MSTEGCPQAPCQFWKTWAWQSMIIQGTRLRTGLLWRKGQLRCAELFHVKLEQAFHLAVDREELAVEVEEALPLRIAVAHRQGVRAAVERSARVDDMRPAFVALRQQD